MPVVTRGKFPSLSSTLSGQSVPQPTPEVARGPNPEGRMQLVEATWRQSWQLVLGVVAAI